MSGIQESLYPQALEGELLYLGTSSSCLLVTEKVYFLLLLYILPASKYMLFEDVVSNTHQFTWEQSLCAMLILYTISQPCNSPTG